MNRRIPPPPPDDYARYRAWRARRAQRLSLLYVPLDPGQIPLRVAVARRSRQDTLRVRARRRALRELPGDVGAAERRHRDIAVAARGSTGTTASSRRSARSAPGLAAAVRPPAFDLGTGIAVLTHRGVVRLVRRRIVAWANENLAGSAPAPAPRS